MTYFIVSEDGKDWFRGVEIACNVSAISVSYAHGTVDFHPDTFQGIGNSFHLLPATDANEEQFRHLYLQRCLCTTEMLQQQALYGESYTLLTDRDIAVIRNAPYTVHNEYHLPLGTCAPLPNCMRV